MPRARRRAASAALGAACALAWTVASGSILSGEEILNQKGKKFLGWQISVAEFRTCDETKIPVFDGVIEKTSDRCRDPKVAPPVFLGGLVSHLNPEKRTVTITIDQLPEKWTIRGSPPKKGDSIELFVPVTVDVQKGTEKNKFFQSIGMGEKLTFKVSGQKTVQYVATEPPTKPLESKS